MDLIFIDDVVFTGIHGVHHREKEQSQRFGVDLEVAADTSPANASDNIDDALNYAPWRDIIRNVIEKESYNLIERIGHRIADDVLADTRVMRVRVRVRKLDIWGNGSPGIVVEKTR